MLDSTLKLIEYLISLFRERENNRDKFLDQYVQPMTELGDAVFRDYLELLHGFRRRIESGESVESLIRSLEDGRVKYLPARMKLRALLHSRSLQFEMTQFERGIFGLLHGGLATFEECSVRHYDFVYAKGHTLLDIAYAISQSGPDVSRSSWLRQVDFQLDALERAWRDVTIAAAEMQASRVPTPPAHFNYRKIGD